MKKRILFVGEHPFAHTGNAGMLDTLVRELDKEKYFPVLFLSDTGVDPAQFVANTIPYPVIHAKDGHDVWGGQRLLDVLSRAEFSAVVTVGLDIWRYAEILPQLVKLKEDMGFKLVPIFPYDLQYIRKDWVNWINKHDFPCVYSRYGEMALKEYVPKLRYFRPNVRNANLWGVLSEGDRKNIKSSLFAPIPEDHFIFGFVGVNQVRKDPQRLVKAFSLIHKENPKTTLYLHSNVVNGFYNLRQYALDCGLRTGDVVSRPEHTVFAQEEMVRVYNGIDCLVNCSMQEGLSWTPLEAMLCGCPVIASDSTSHIELVKGAGVLVPCDELSYLPLKGKEGQTWMEARSCKVSNIVKAMKEVMENDALRKEMKEKGLRRAKEWVSEKSNVNTLLDEVVKEKPLEIVETTGKVDAVLFVQHSSAGDVLMSTQCFKGIKEKYRGKKLIYMTQPQFRGIVEGNEYLDEIVDFDIRSIGKYEVVYNPHGEKILPGGWNNLDVKLHYMYPYFCKVTPDSICIVPQTPKKIVEEGGFDFDQDYIVLNSGGKSAYRQYTHFDTVFKGISLPVVQIGSEDDPEVGNVVDLRGKLSWRESAWVMGKAHVAVTVDSFCAHLAGAMDTPVVVLFGPAPARVTSPRVFDEKRLVCLEPNLLDVCSILSHCWGNIPYGKERCKSPCINTISPLKVRRELKKLLEETQS